MGIHDLTTFVNAHRDSIPDTQRFVKSSSSGWRLSCCEAVSDSSSPHRCRVLVDGPSVLLSLIKPPAPPPSQSLCRFFLGPHGCRNDPCRFSHASPPAGSSASPPASPSASPSASPVALVRAPAHFAQGRVKFFDLVKGFGFIARADGSADVFFHQSALSPPTFLPLPDSQVRFSTRTKPDGKIAASTVIDGSPSTQAAPLPTGGAPQEVSEITQMLAQLQLSESLSFDVLSGILLPDLPEFSEKVAAYVQLWDELGVDLVWYFDGLADPPKHLTSIQRRLQKIDRSNQLSLWLHYYDLKRDRQQRPGERPGDVGLLQDLLRIASRARVDLSQVSPFITTVGRQALKGLGQEMVHCFGEADHRLTADLQDPSAGAILSDDSDFYLVPAEHGFFISLTGLTVDLEARSISGALWHDVFLKGLIARDLATPAASLPFTPWLFSYAMGNDYTNFRHARRPPNMDQREYARQRVASAAQTAAASSLAHAQSPHPADRVLEFLLAHSLVAAELLSEATASHYTQRSITEPQRIIEDTRLRLSSSPHNELLLSLSLSRRLPSSVLSLCLPVSPHSGPFFALSNACEDLLAPPQAGSAVLTSPLWLTYLLVLGFGGKSVQVQIPLTAGLLFAHLDPAQELRRLSQTTPDLDALPQLKDGCAMLPPGLEGDRSALEPDLLHALLFPILITLPAHLRAPTEQHVTAFLLENAHLRAHESFLLPLLAIIYSRQAAALYHRPIAREYLAPLIDMALLLSSGQPLAPGEPKAATLSFPVSATYGVVSRYETVLDWYQRLKKVLGISQPSFRVLQTANARLFMKLCAEDSRFPETLSLLEFIDGIPLPECRSDLLPKGKLLESGELVDSLDILHRMTMGST